MNNIKTTKINKKTYLYLSPQQSHNLAFSLAKKINTQITKGKVEKPQILVGIARGAYAWIKTIGDWLNISHITNIRIVHYAGVEKTTKDPIILDSHLPTIKGKRILLFDNVVETGKTMHLACKHLKKFSPQKITTSVLFYKKTSQFKPDFYIKEQNAWIIFHHEVLESVKCLGTRWINKGIDLKEIEKRFLKIGIPKKEVTTALKILFNYP